MKNPRVSVIIPTYNCSPMLRQALESVRQQTVQDLEVIVVDDGSTDQTYEVIREFGSWVTYLRQENQGVAAARNTGIRLSSAPYIAFLDSDDLWLPNKLERQLAFLRSHPQVGLVYGRMWSYSVNNPAKRRLDPQRVSQTFKDLLNGPNTVTTSTVVIRRECFETVGLFNPTLRAAEDHELWLRIVRRFPIGFIDEVLAEYRRHGDSINTDHPVMYEGYRGYFEIILSEYRPWLKNPRATERQLAKFEYLCGTTTLKRGEGRKAAQLIRRALSRDLRLGTQFIRRETPWLKKLWLPLKPYAAWAASALRTLV